MANPSGPDQDFVKFYEIFKSRRLALSQALEDKSFTAFPSNTFADLESDAYGAPACDGLTQRALEALKDSSNRLSKDKLASMLQQLTILESFKKQLFSSSMNRGDAYALWRDEMLSDPQRVEQMSADLGLVAARRRNRVVL